MSEEQPQGFLNRGITGLLILFTIPAILTVGAMVVVAMQGRVPGGEETSCIKDLGTGTQVRLKIYAYQAGLSLFETQSIEISQDNATSWQELSSDTVQWPAGIDCENNIQQLDEDIWLSHSEKSLAISDDNGSTWQTFNVCDEPRPTTGRCDADPLSFSLNYDSETREFVIIVREAITDEYGQPLYENAAPRLAGEWTVSTSDAGRSWSLETE